MKEKKEKTKTIKIFYSGNALNERLNRLKNEKCTFTISFTGYTAIIKIGRFNEYYVKESVKNSFEIAQKIKSAIINSKIYVDEVHSDKIKYFSLNKLKAQKIKKVYNVDINAAYPTALLNLGFISKELFDELQALPKMKKLKAIGMLATKKTVFEFENGQQVKAYFKVNDELRNVWFAICQEVGEAIDECKQNIKSFLFFWFDGIYYSDESETEKIIEILNKRKFASKKEVLSNFTVIHSEHNVMISYLKGDRKTPKNFCIPKAERAIYG